MLGKIANENLAGRKCNGNILEFHRNFWLRIKSVADED